MPGIVEFDLDAISDRFSFMQGASFEVSRNVLRVRDGIERRNRRISIFQPKSAFEEVRLVLNRDRVHRSRYRLRGTPKRNSYGQDLANLSQFPKPAF